jgi:hypothetical protein
MHGGTAMTIAISVKVHNGLVLAADSASAISATGPGAPPGVLNVYNNANKITNLCKERPIGATTWGASSIGKASMSTLFKDLRRRLMDCDPSHAEWKLTESNCTIEHIAQQTRLSS